VRTDYHFALQNYNSNV